MGEIKVVTTQSQPGFNPLDLLYAALSSCLSLSASIAAVQLGVADRIETIEVRVTGERSTEKRSRVEEFHVALSISGDVDRHTREQVGKLALEIGTIGNTIRGNPTISMIYDD
ncbi:OsmC family peroxiredoxin [Rhizobium leguminosarum]|nr:OsmC family peroxiredoxin [Rhizobium leguminosarum]